EINAKIAETLKALPEKDIVALQAQGGKARLATMQQPPRAGLAAHWEFDGHLADTSGNYHHGRVVRGEVSYGDGQVGRAAEFGGETEVDLGNVGAFDRATPFSLAFWFMMGSAKEVTSLQKVDPSASHRGYEVPLDDTTRVAELTRGSHLLVRRTHQWPQ